MPSTNFEETKRLLQKALGGSFHVIELIGHGGMGEVYLVQHKLLGGKYAFKVLSRELASDPSLAERFLTEARIEFHLKHPNIVRVDDVDQREGLYYLKMQYIEGEDLDTRIRRMGLLDPPSVADISLQVARALEFAHEYDKGIVHRDLKPSNIRIDESGTAYVIDFGIAKVRDASLTKITQTGMLGTTLYMSPEQLTGSQADARSDLYSLGVIMYEMLTSDNPFAAPSGDEIRDRIRNYPPPPVAEIRSDVQPKLSLIVEKLMAKDPGMRYQRARKLKEELSTIQTNERAITPAPAATPVPPRRGIRLIRPVAPVDTVGSAATPAVTPEMSPPPSVDPPRVQQTPSAMAAPATYTPAAPTPAASVITPRQTPAFPPVSQTPRPIFESTLPQEAAVPLPVVTPTPVAENLQTPAVIIPAAAPTPAGNRIAEQQQPDPIFDPIPQVPTPQTPAPADWQSVPVDSQTYTPNPAAHRTKTRLRRQIEPLSVEPAQETSHQGGRVHSGPQKSGFAHLPHPETQNDPEPPAAFVPREAGKRMRLKNEAAVHTRRVRISISPTAKPLLLVAIISAIAVLALLLTLLLRK